MIIKKLDKPDRIIAPPVSRYLKSRFQVLAPGEEVGEHVTDQREELILILKGTATIIEKGLPTELAAGHAVYLPANVRHNVRNDGTEPLHYVYVVALFDGTDHHHHH